MMMRSLPLLALALMGTAAAQPPPDRDAAQARVTEAMRRQDYPAALAAETAWARQHPTDLRFRHLEPLLHRLAGDEPGWANARAELLRIGAGARTPETTDRSVTIDMVPLGTGRMFAEQCYEEAGHFGVSYRLNVLGSDGRTASFFTVESPPAENQMRREMKLPAPSYTLDHFTPGRHATVAFLPGAPVYEDIRQRALAYLADPQPISGSNTGDGLAGVGCELKAR